MLVKKDSTNVSVELYIVDDTDGTPELGVVWNTSGIDLNYRRDGAVVTTIVEATLSALTDAHSDGGFLEIANGRYRFDVPDAAFATGVSKVTIGGTVAGMVVLPVVIQLVDFDPEDVADLGLTNLDATVSSRMATYTQPTGFLAATFPTTVASTTNITAGTITNLTNLPSIPTNWITTAGITDGALTAAKFAANSLDGKGDWVLASSAPTNWSSMGIEADGDVHADVKEWLGTAVTAGTAGVPNVNTTELNGVSNYTARIARWMQNGHHGTTQAGSTASTIVLAAGASAANDTYNGHMVVDNTTGEQRLIVNYTGASRTADVVPDWVTTPGTAENYTTIPFPAADVQAIQSDAQSTTDLKDFVDAGYDPATNKVEGVKLVDTTTTNTDMLSATAIVSGGAITTSGGAVSNVTLVATTTTNTDMITTAAVNAEVDTALADIGLDHLISSALPTSWAVDVAANSVFDQIADDGTAAYDRTTDSLQAISDSGGGGLTQQQVRDAMKLAPTGGAPGVGSVDEHLDDIKTKADSLTFTAPGELDVNVFTLQAGVISNDSYTAGAITAAAIATDAIDADALAADAIAEINATVDIALSDIGLDHLISVALPTNWATDVTANSVLDYMADDGTAVYDRTTDSLQAISDSGGGGLTQQQVRDAMKLAPTGGAPSAGSVDEHLDTIETDTAAMQPTIATNLDAAVSTRMATYTQPTGFLAATFPTTVASTTNITAGTITTTTNLTNLPSIPANWITTAGITDGALTAAKFAANSLDGKGDWVLASSAPTNWSSMGIEADGDVHCDLKEILGQGSAAIRLQRWLLAAKHGATQAGSTASTIVLDAGQSSTTDKFVGQMVVDIANDEGRLITAYDGGTKTATVTPDWITTPGTADDFVVMPWPGADIQAIIGDAQSATDLKDFSDEGYDPATNKVEGVKLVDTTTTNTDMLLATAIVSGGAITTSGGAVSNVTLVATTTTNTDMLTAVAVNAEVDTALSDIGLDHLISSALPTNWATDVAANSVFDNIADDGTAVYDRTTDSLQAISDSGGGGLTQQQVRDAMKLAPTGGAPSVGSVDEHLDDVLTDTNSLNDTKIPDTISLANINAQVDTALSDIGLDHLISVALPTSWTADVTANSVLDYMADDGTAVYDRTTDSLQAISDSGGGGLTQQQVRDAMKLAPTGGAPGAGSVDEHLDTIETDTAAMQPTIATNLDATVSSRMATTHINATGGAVDNVTLVDTTTTNTDMRGTDNALLAASAPTNFGDLAITVTTGQVTVGTNNDKTGYSISGAITTLDGLNNVAATDIVSAGAITTLAGAVVNVDLVDVLTTYTGNTPQTADHTANISAILTDTSTTLDDHLTDIKGTAFVKDTHSLTNIEGYVDLIDDGTSGLAKIATDAAAILVDTTAGGPGPWTTTGGGGGGGAWTISVTVDDGTNPLENATVRFTEGANTYNVETDVNGLATFNLDAATYTVAITKHGYTYSGTTNVVSADASVTYSMTQVNIPTSTVPNAVNAYIYTYDETGALASVPCKAQLAHNPLGTGVGYIPTLVEENSDTNGLFDFAAYKGGTYWVYVAGKAQRITIPTNAADPYEIPSQIGGEL